MICVSAPAWSLLRGAGPVLNVRTGASSVTGMGVLKTQGRGASQHCLDLRCTPQPGRERPRWPAAAVWVHASARCILGSLL